jgi:hypothetical protein
MNDNMFAANLKKKLGTPLNQALLGFVGWLMVGVLCVLFLPTPMSLIGGGFALYPTVRDGLKVAKLKKTDPNV